MEGVSQAMQTAYDEMSSFVDYQLEITENLDQELLTLTKFTILSTGAIYPVFNIIVQPNNQIQFRVVQPWLALAALVLIYSAWFSAQGYRNGIYYGGFQDSPFLDFESLTNIESSKKYSDLDVGDIEFLSDEEFFKRLLNDYSIGINHNNWEISLKSQLVHQTFKLITLSVAIFVVGIIINLSTNFGSLGEFNVHTGLFIGTLGVAAYQIRDAHKTYEHYSNRQENEDRLSASDYEES